MGQSARAPLFSMLVGVALAFLIFVGRQEIWSWRLALYGATAGAMIGIFCQLLDRLVGDRLRRRRFLPDKLVGVPLYFVGGCAGILTATAAMQALGLMPFKMRGADLRFTLLLTGGVAIVIGLLFYSFGIMRRKLRDSIVRIKEQEFAEKELELARSIQRRLLPPQEISGEGYRISARNLAARFVAGDFYDVFPLSDGALGIVVADVSGKGMGASLIMASVKAVLPFIAEGRHAAETLTLLNRRLHGELAAREFVALAYARYEPLTGAFELANAGLPDPYLVHRDGTLTGLGVPGARLPLGARSEVAYESMKVPLRPGQRVLLFTDGLPEAPTASGDPLGYELLERLVPAAADAETPGELLDRIFASVRNLTTPALVDDWTALLLEARPLGIS